MKRIRFRRVLPIVQLALFVALLVVGKQEQRAYEAGREAARVASLSKGETGSEVIIWHLLRRYVPPALRINGAVNFPVELAAGLLGTGSSIKPDSLEMKWVVKGLGVLVLWFSVGIWLDRRLGLVPAPPQHRPWRIVQVLTKIACAVCVLFAALMTYVAIYTHHDDHLVYVPSAAWAAFGALVLALLIRRWRQLARSAEASQK